MKKENKKVPKNNEESYVITSDAEAILYGLLFVLVGLIGLLNRGPVGQFFTYCVVFLFGAFHIFFFALLIFLGIYLMVKKKFYHIRIDLKLLGFFLMLLGLTIGASLESGLTIQNAYLIFSQRMENVQDSLFHISSLTQIPLSGGGIIGYFLAGILNSSLTEMGTKIVIVLFLMTGFLLVFKDPLVKFILKIHQYRKKRKAIRKEEQNRKDAEELEKKAQKEEDSLNKQEEMKEEPTLGRMDINPEDLFDEFPSKDSDDLFMEEDPIIMKDNDAKKEEKNPISFFDDEDENTSIKDEIVEVKEEKPYSPFEEHHEEKKSYVGPYIYPPLSLLSDEHDTTKNSQNFAIADENVRKINNIFKEYNIGAQAISYTVGPSVTRFDIKVNPGVKLTSLSSIQNELALKLGGDKTVRVELIIEGKDTSGIEIGNKFPTMVPFKDVYKEMMGNMKDKLMVPLGRNISGDVVKISIDELPHLLVAGTTGSGKSVFIHSIIMTLIMRNTPEELRLLLVDPKRVEFSKYHDLPHLLCPIITDPSEATTALKRMVDEMERRYDVFATKGKGASKYSEYMEIAELYHLEKMPVIIMIVDEFADFMSHNAKEVEASIQRIAQKARAAGIYMILATQRPSVGFVSGDIKANIPSRIALSVATAMDSRVIIDENGAETLLGKGDLLARVPISKTLIRVQSPFVPSKDIIAVCDYIREHSEVHYYEPFLDLKEHIDLPTFDGGGQGISGRRTELDPLHEEVKRYVLETKVASTSKIQNNFQVGFSRADYILDCLEREGIVKRVGNRRVVVGASDDEGNHD